MPSARRSIIALLSVATAAALLAAPAPGKTVSERIDRNLCQTVGGGRFVAIPGFPGERIDRRLLPDIQMLVRRYKVFITDGYSTDRVHSRKGEHPIGLALDIVPDFAAGGTWRDIGRLADWAEPKQNRPRAPFRWVGYDGDAGHGRGHHLHLSWDHSETKPGKAARTVYSLRCPGADEDPAPTPAPDKGDGKGKGGSGGANGGSGGGATGDDDVSSGGVTPDKRKGGKSGRRASRETGGISIS